MSVSISEVDLGPCRGRRYDVGADRWAVILPGAMYLPDAPLLWFSREAALTAGRNVVAAWDTFDRRGDPLRWTDERLRACLAIASGDPHPLVIAKSLTTLATGIAADLELPAVWLTPLLAGDPRASIVVDGLQRATAPCMLVGGTADPVWDAALASSFRAANVVEIDNADHVLQIAADVEGSIETLRRVAHAVMEFATV